MTDYTLLAEYVAKAKENDEDAFTYLYHKTCNFVYATASSMLRDPVEAEDIVQEVYIKVYRRLHMLRDDRSFVRWLHMITINTCQDHISSRHSVVAPAEEDQLPDASDDAVDDWFSNQCRKAMLMDMIQALPPNQRKVVYHYYYNQLSVGEIAALEDCSINTVKSRLFYARNTLRRAIEDEEQRTGEKYHLPAAVAAMTAQMLLPYLGATLTQERAAHILLSVLTAVGVGATEDGMKIVSRVEEDETDKDDVKPGLFARLSGFFRQSWFVRLRTSFFVTTLCTVIILVGAVVGISYSYGKRSGDADTDTDAPIDTNTQTTENQLLLTNPPDTSEPQPAVLAIGKCGDDASFVLTEDGKLTISGSGRIGSEEDEEMDGEEDSILMLEELAPYQNRVTELVIGEGITEIGYCAFRGVPNLRSVSLSSTCTIFRMAAFAECPNLTEIELPYGTDRIPIYLFKDCTRLASVKLPETVQEIDHGAFLKCRSLQSLELPAGLSYIRSYAFSKSGLREITIPKQITELVENTFYECKLLEKVNLPDSMIRLDDYVFGGCAILSSIELPPRLSYLGCGVFADSGLTDIDLPDGITEIPDSCFSHCLQLTKITLPSQIAAVAENTFVGTPIAELILPNTTKARELLPDLLSELNSLKAIYFE